MRKNLLNTAVFLLFLIIGLLLYRNSSQHEFHLDSGHTVLENPWVRDLGHIPRYFVDPATFSVLRSNIDYRPVLQLSYALDYHFGAYQMPIWHYTQVVIHVWCAFWLYLLGTRLGRLSGWDSKSSRFGAFLAALTFLVHPTESGVVNYLSARSSELTAAFLLPSFYLYAQDSHKAKAGSCAFFVLALFTKVEAVAALAVFFFLEVWQCWERGASLGRSVSNFAKSRRFTPFFAHIAAAIGYLVIRQIVMKDYHFAEAAARPGMTAFDYFATQITVWWFYLIKWFVPLDLVADNMGYPVYTTFTHPVVLLAVGAWLIAFAGALRSWPTRPLYLILGLSYIALLSPTSSIVPLAEMVNEHRPYLPIALASLIWSLPLGCYLTRSEEKSIRALVGVGLILAFLGLSSLTVSRNKVFLTARAYWKDVLEKSPSSRAYVNYGLSLMNSGDLTGAEKNFAQSLELAPRYYIAHIDAGIVADKLGHQDSAQEHFNQAVAYDPNTGGALIWRGRWHLNHNRFAEALEDFQAASKVSLDAYSVHAGMAQAYLGVGSAQQAAQQTIAAEKINAVQLGRDIISIARPGFLAGKENVGLAYFNALEKLGERAWWVSANQALLLEKLNRVEEAQAKKAEAAALKGGG